MERTKVFYLYTGTPKQDRHRYIILQSLEQNNGDSIVNSDIEIADYKGQITSAPIGAIFEVEREGNTIFYNKRQMPVAYWKNAADKLEWQTIKRAVDTLKSQQNAAKKDYFLEQLNPIKDVYQGLSYQERRALLAEVIRVITT